MSEVNEQLKVLFVCTANICRSPTAELLARDRFGESSVLFRSAGFMRSGQPVPDDLKKVLGKRPIDATVHASSTLDPESLMAADLILTMEGRHIQKLTVMEPDAFVKAIPLIEAAERLAVPKTFDEFQAELSRREPSAYLSSQWDVDDPYKRGKRRYRKMVDQVDGLVATVFSNLR